MGNQITLVFPLGLFLLSIVSFSFGYYLEAILLAMISAVTTTITKE